ncbi:peroxiredoxin [Streptomyces sulfonofaciens]|uniref:thioredoxin-dependent peroxiredoxin n=1 Tax=Streptomyces sulfonofaciens TaxID=68272 RepID=A0A919L7M4_9ACTN|nr:peroxiredoxin-like family protein [Streptomyces sulfonofaciens]GHH86439.1 peroxiredoxin [Streptomyces sulfonofaciens]
MTTAPTPIADEAAAVMAGQVGQLPDEIRAAFTDEQAELDAVGVPADVAAPGSPMPDAALLDAHGQPTTLTQARDGRPAVVVFYRGAWCPFCNAALRTYDRELTGALGERDVALIAVSPQKPDGSLTMQESNALSYPVLSDPGNRIGTALGIVTRPSDGARHAQAALGLDLREVNADGTHDVVMPTVAVVDAAGVLRWLDVHPNYTTRTEPGEILTAVATHLP